MRIGRTTLEERAVATRDVIPAVPGELTVQQVAAQVVKIQELMKLAMKEDEHFGIIPGTNKPTLLKAGAEKLCLMFRLDPQYTVHEIREGEHLTVTSTCVLYHVTSGARMGSGMGSCSTRESKYAYRKAERVCPTCGKAAIIRGQKDYGGGWVCWKKKEGCGAKFEDGDGAIEKQDSGRVLNVDLPDQYNTVLKMSNKRSLCAAVLNVTAASDIFTQDMEDLQDRMEPVNVTPTDDGKKDEPKTEKRQRTTKLKPDTPPADAMTPEQTKELNALLDQVEEISPGSRETTVDSICRSCKGKDGKAITSLEFLTTGQATAMINTLTRNIEKRRAAAQGAPDGQG
jgi:hypothetical protein